MSPIAAISKPSRSEEILTPEERAAAFAKVEAFFSATAPKRTSKPSRSDVGENSGDTEVVEVEIPELKTLEALKASGHTLPFYSTPGDFEEYVETMYYKSLPTDGVHHTTGTGFIQTEKKEVPAFYPLIPGQEASFIVSRKTNPATNEWEPSPSTLVITSTKPGRSDAA